MIHFSPDVRILNSDLRIHISQRHKNTHHKDIRIQLPTHDDHLTYFTLTLGYINHLDIKEYIYHMDIRYNYHPHRTI